MKRILGTMASAALLVLTAAPAMAGGGGHGGGCPEQNGTARGTRVLMQNFCFKPGNLRIEPGNSVTFVNYDEAPHTVTSTDGTDALELQFDQGMYSIVRFTKAGVYAYRCVFHAGMIGQIRVGNSTAKGAEDGVTTVKTGIDTIAAPAPVIPATTPTAHRSAAPSRAGFGLLGLIPVAGLAWFIIRRHRRAAA